MSRTIRRVFDEAYYKQFYHSPKTRVKEPRDYNTLIDFVASFCRWVDIPVRRILDAGCGLGYWRDPLARHFPKARYVGFEYSGYL